MRHLLMCRGAGIGEDAIAGLGNALVSRDSSERAEDSCDLHRRGFLGEIVERDVFAFGDHENMRRSLRADVVKGEDVLVLIDLLAGDFAAQDPGEDIVGIVGHHPPPFWIGVYRFARARFSAMPEVPSRRVNSAATSAGEIPAAAHSTSK